MMKVSRYFGVMLNEADVGNAKAKKGVMHSSTFRGVSVVSREPLNVW